MRVQLFNYDQSTAIAEVDVPGDGGFPTPGVIVYKGQYFVGPNTGYGPTAPSYIQTEGVVISEDVGG
jgi:hypothetical protein